MALRDQQTPTRPGTRTDEVRDDEVMVRCQLDLSGHGNIDATKVDAMRAQVATLVTSFANAGIILHGGFLPLLDEPAPPADELTAGMPLPSPELTGKTWAQHEHEQRERARERERERERPGHTSPPPVQPTPAHGAPDKP